MNKKNTNSKKHQKIKHSKITNTGFSITEIVVAASMVGILSSVALPNYMNSMQSSERSEAQSIVASIPSIISAYIDATGELPTKWDDLSSIAAVMTNNGTATGDLTDTITLPDAKYELSVTGPTDSTYTLTAIRIINNAEEPEEIDEDRFAIQSCFNVSNGASDLKSGMGIENEEVLNCG